jgi:hypothetical protein
MKIKNKAIKNTYICVILIIYNVIACISTDMGNNLSLSNSDSNKIEKKSVQDFPGEYFNNNINKDGQYVLPHIISKSPDYILQHHSIIPLENNINIPVMPMHHLHNMPYGPMQAIHPIHCECAAQVRCKPCAVLAQPVEPDVFPFMSPMDCPCAPKLNCPNCPPLSLLHEIASKKVY